jgi:aryl-alcohol dehydrogenase-like predicted oxidoreductase
MEYMTMGRSGLKVSRACLGAMNFGTGADAPTGEAEATRIISRFLDAGHNFIDTADGYTDGQSEEIVGRAVAGRRDAVVIATKGWSPQGPGPNDWGSARAHLTRALDASLRRLGTDYVDLYQVHLWDPVTPIEETMATLDGFVRSGKVRYLGCSNFTTGQIVEAQWAADRVHGTRLVSLQPQYSLVTRDVEAEILPACERHGLGTLVYSPLGGGVLAGRYRRGADPERGTRLSAWMSSPLPPQRQWATDLLSDRSFDVADEVAKVATELDATPAAVAIAWVRGRPGVTSVIVGPRTHEQLQQYLAGMELELPGELRSRLDEVSGPPPGPVTGQSAPITRAALAALMPGA